VTLEEIRRRVAALPGNPTMWLAAVGLLVALIALAVAVTRTAAPTVAVGATGPVGPTAPVAGTSPTADSASTSPTVPTPTTTPATAPTAQATGDAPGAVVDCPAATIVVGTADELTAALEQAAAGTVVELRDGTYTGQFTGTAKGTADKPIYVCGGPGAVIDGGGVKKGYAFHLDGADHWRLLGFTVRNSQKGVMADRTNHSVISGLDVTQIGDEAIHLRKFSSDNLVENNTVSDTGRRRDKFGEGVYVGTANSNWQQITGGGPDTSDRNVIRGNTIRATTAEAIDIKEGTTGGTVAGNTFDGSALTGADSWVDVKGNDWTIRDNSGTHSPEDGFQTHQVYAGWGRGNTFTANKATVDGAGYGFHLAPVLSNRVACDNKATGAARGLSNTPCS